MRVHADKPRVVSCHACGQVAKYARIVSICVRCGQGYHTHDCGHRLAKFLAAADVPGAPQHHVELAKSVRSALAARADQRSEAAGTGDQLSSAVDAVGAVASALEKKSKPSKKLQGLCLQCMMACACKGGPVKCHASVVRERTRERRKLRRAEHTKNDQVCDDDERALAAAALELMAAALCSSHDHTHDEAHDHAHDHDHSH
eukprot:PRCOL_00000285-RA